MMSPPKRTILVAVPVLLFAVIAAKPGNALAQSESHLFLVVPPLPEDPADSAFAVKLAEELRKEVRFWGERRVVPYHEMCQILRAADYSCGKLLQDDEAAQLAAAFHTDAYITGSLSTRQDLVLELRITARNRSGFAGTFELRADRDLKMDSVVTLAALGLDAFWISAALARNCYEARDAGEYEEAIFYAGGARSVVPNHSAASLCEASVYELTDESIPKLIRTYAHAFASDRRLDQALHRLMTLYFEYGDTLSANVLMAEELRRAPYDATLRTRVAYNWIVVGVPDSAFTVLWPGHGEREVSANLELLRVISQACLQREEWRCQFEAMERLYQIDPPLRGDTLFYYQIVGVAQNLGDQDGVLRWTTEGVAEVGRRFDEEGRIAPEDRLPIRALRMAQAAALAESGSRDSAVAVYLDMARGDTTDVRPLLAAAEALLNPRFLVIDSAVPLDTAAMRWADSLLTAVAQEWPEDSVYQTVATSYFSPAAAMVRHRVEPELASAWLEKALTYDVERRIHETANGLNGLALSYVVEQLDGLIREQESCDLVDRIEETIERARRATLIGREAMPDMAGEILPVLDEYATFVPQYREVLGCVP